MKPARPSKRDKKDEIVLLRDLTPRKEVIGGAGKRLFGERRDASRDASEGRTSRTALTGRLSEWFVKGMTAGAIKGWPALVAIADQDRL